MVLRALEASVLDKTGVAVKLGGKTLRGEPANDWPVSRSAQTRPDRGQIPPCWWAGYFPEQGGAEQEERKQTEKHFPTLPSPSLFPLRAFLFSFPFFFSSFFLLGKKRARGAGSSRSQHARKAQPAVGIRLDFSTGSRGLFFCLLASSRKCATCSHRVRAVTRPPNAPSTLP